MRWLTFTKLLQNIETVNRLIVGLPLEQQLDLKQYYCSNGAIMEFIKTIPWTPMMVHEFNMVDGWDQLIETPDIVTFRGLRFFRYDSDASIWKLSV